MNSKVRTNRRIPAWLLILGGWTVFGLYMAFQNHYVAAGAGRPESWALSLTRELVYSTLWAILTPIILRIGRWFPLDRTNWLRFGFLHLLVSAVISLCHKALFSLAMAEYDSLVTGSSLSWERLARTLFVYFDYGILLYWILILFQTGINFYRKSQESLLRSSRLESQLAQAQLLSLKMQLQPHFLFNTLNAISVLVGKDPERARRTIGRLSDLLRLTLDQGAMQEVPLASELTFLERYLAIEKTRFEDRLIVRLTVDKDSTDALVPALILQPLVENAIKHGVARRRGPTRINISVTRLEGMVRLAIRNDLTASAPPFAAWKEGVGLANTRERIHRLYGAEARLDVKQDEPGEVSVEITLPYHRETAGG